MGAYHKEATPLSADPYALYEAEDTEMEIGAYFLMNNDTNCMLMVCWYAMDTASRQEEALALIQDRQRWLTKNQETTFLIVF